MAMEDYVIHEEDVHLINQELTNFINESEAKCALLVNRDGHLVSQEGFTGSIDTTALSALLAGSVASTRELARLSNSRGVTHGVVVSPDAKYAFVSVEGAAGEPGALDVIDLDTLELVATVDVGRQASGITFWKIQ